ncbi:MAG: hypothetical protein ABSG79_20735 [Bryobacteraceae bacterium]
MTPLIGSLSLRRRAALACLGLSLPFSIAPLPLRAQSSSVGIVGLATATTGQTLTFRLMNGSQQLVPDSWRQLYNPDRYTGTEWVTSFDLQLQANADGSLTATARYPGRYKIAAVQGGQQYTAAVIVQPAQTPFKMKGIDFGGTSPFDRAYAANAIAIARHTGADTVLFIESVCIDLNNPGIYQYTDQQSSWCTTATSFSDLGWLIDEFHSQGFKVVLEPTVTGYYQGFFDELEDFLPGGAGGASTYPEIPASEVPALFQAWGQMAVDVATLAAAHQVEIYVPGSHDIGYAQFDSTTANTLNADWKTLIQNIRAVYTGQVWWGPVDPCGLDSFPFTNFSLVDGIWFSGLSVSASTPPCTLDSGGINNIHAEQMLAYLRALRSASSGFQYGQKYALPTLWTDFLTDPIDGMNYLGGHYTNIVLGSGSGTYASQSGANPNLTRDYQEGVDFLDAVMQAGVIEGGFQVAFPGTVGLSSNAPFNDILARPAVLASLTNWYGGDTSYFAPCMTPLPPNVVIQLPPSTSCPVAVQMSQANLSGDLTLVNDSTSSVNPYYEGGTTTGGDLSFGSPSWADFDMSAAVRLRTNLSAINLNFRLGSGPGVNDYGVLMGQGAVLLLKGVYSSANGQTYPTLAQQALPGQFDPAHWYQVEITAMGNAIVVKIDGNQLIQYTDNSSPYLAGSVDVHIPGGLGTADFGNLVVTSLAAPQVVNAASFAPGVIAPGEIVTLFGGQLGPQTLVAADASKTFPTSLGGTQVLFNGAPAPLIYTQAGQVSAIVPWELAGSATAAVTVQYQEANSSVTVAVAGTSTALFTLGGGFGPGAILNQDYTVNSPSNPAAGGSVILLYGTGGGALQGSATDGALAPGAALLQANVSVLVGGQPAQVLYAGAAPGLVNGLVQINVQLPAGVTGDTVPVLATVGQYISQSGVTAAIQ